MKIQSHMSKRKPVTILLIILAVLLGLTIWLHFPLMQNAGSSNGYNCSRLHIYIPRRLDFLGCRTVTGTIKRIKIEPDGDSHALLMPDKQFAYLLTKQNYQKQDGYLVIEDTCHSNPKDVLAHLVCLNYRSPVPSPRVGERYEITGNYVIDEWHGSWAEIHGVSELKELK